MHRMSEQGEIMSPRYLTKSRFKLAIECPTKLFYSGKKVEYRDAMAENDFLAMLADGGYQVGALAKLLYPDGIEVEGLNHAEAEAQTQELLKRENVVIFEPAIRVGDFFIRIDILVKRGNQFELIEVKAKSYNTMEPSIEGRRGGINSKMLPYIQDAAFQTWVLQQAFPDGHITTFLMMPDKCKLAPIDGLNQMFKVTDRSEVALNIPTGTNMKAVAEMLLAKVSVDQYVAEIINTPLNFPGGPATLSEAASIWGEAYRNDKRIKPQIGSWCGKCQFISADGDPRKSGFHECWKMALNWSEADFENGTVLDLYNFRGKDRLISQGVYKISQVVREDIGDFEDEPNLNGLSGKQRQWLQVNGIPPEYDHGGFYFDATLASVEMSKWKYPLHLIDFETATVALPFYEGMRPYEPVAFQFSHHIIEADGNVKHAGQFLCDAPGVFPNYQFATALKAELENDEGSVFMWSHHENTILSKIIDQLAEDPNRPDDAEVISSFLKRLTRVGDRPMVDLCDIDGRIFFHPDTKGSSSIKKVLPAILKVSDFLRDKYSEPIYGAPNGIPSLNYSSPNGYAWLDKVGDGQANDPYAKLKQLAKDLIPVGAEQSEESSSVIAEGGAAATAYARLQFEDMNEHTRKRISGALLRYCELDTLAMVMIVEAWKEIANR